MDAGIHYFTFTHPDWEHRLTDRLTATAQAADQGGVSLLTVMDHYFQMIPVGGPFEPMLEATPPSATSPASPTTSTSACSSPG